ncbi:ATP-dependent DNA helicase RecG [Lachnoclostridium phytofermentans]|uniref:ATP-dependent DNA helicase RecG n=1 Tax=Lachnoclostridium phytofermentans (strain ATCC 700394 / DSM 18823 / ISDg) TaxID=357809 RepID=A9KPH4_LACP7|nr:ATP-dependent DNA helicase RecG [Lachnoclostridium phytofermentans]ABX43248.1 ATP-dependent DNA helicase RecG [Lachnoclostridium phytofermentans ISDg]
MQLTDSLGKIKGIGEKTELKFHKLSLFSVNDLIEHYPRGYEVYEMPKPISSAVEGTTIAIEAGIASIAEVKKIRNLQIITCMVRDPSGTIKLTWFNQPFLKNTLRMGARFIFRGKVTRKNGSLVIGQPKIYKQEEYRILLNVMQPIYALTEGLTNHTVSKAVNTVLSQIDDFKEFLPKTIIKEQNLISRKAAIREIHFPKARDTMLEARRRLVFDEFFIYTVILQRIRENKGSILNGFVIKEQQEVSELIAGLPYELTNAQKKVWEEVKKDLLCNTSMNRLIQGDVGSGKTILAVLALLLVAKNGYQGCFMVPTEVLAKQHLEALQSSLTRFGVKIELLVGSMTASMKRKAYQRIENHEVDIIVGTHALIQEKVIYDKLALVITDEQHRFGVKQRESLLNKGDNPHVLVMSATPIPRTLAIILYGDLDISVVDELPANRLPIKNCVVDSTYRETAYRFIGKQISEGRQAYVICPMVEESETMEAENVVEYTEKLKEALPSINGIEYLHGKMKPKDKDDIMGRFASGEIKVLVSTTVVEVGVNVPNSTVMMIENAERFGLAQLHQLRGRVGRGAHQSYCILVSGSSSKETMERLEILNKSNDGFFIASEDLKLRGPGDLFGIRQSGDLEFKIGDIYQDASVLKAANEAAKNLTAEEYLSLCDNYPALQDKFERLAMSTL